MATIEILSIFYRTFNFYFPRSNRWRADALVRTGMAKRSRFRGSRASRAEPGASPHYLVGSTLGDELRASNDYQSRVVSISLKDRSAILPGGHTANAAYWYSSTTGQFVTSTYYMPSLPPWAIQFNSQ